MIRDKIRGSLFGGAVGDALGYPVEFIGEYSIFSKYGDRGITSYELNKNGKAVISDDTQMVLFTANGLLAGNTAFCMQGKEGFPRLDVEQAYLDWLLTQISSRQQVNGHERFTKEGGYSWLLDVPELYARRAPGITCLRALEGGTYGKEDFIRNPRNDRKGCGGIMRVAPVALMYRPDENCNIDIKTLDWEAAQIAAITHGHSLGYMPAAVVSHIITRILTSDSQVNLKEIVLDARDAMKEIFSADENLDELVRIIDLAVSLSENSRDDLKNIHALGEGWVAEETLGISLYCALKYQEDFSAGIIASVNHKGDSDSTGAVTGNILGALVGYDAIEEKWKQDLELSDVILEMADDLYQGCLMEERGYDSDQVWMTKYVRMHRYAKGSGSIR